MKSPSRRRDPALTAIVPGAGKADLHIHTNASDGGPTPKEVLDFVERKTDLDVIAITDHDTITGALEAKRLHDAGNYRFDLVVGQEITSTAGHIIGLFLKKAVPKEQSPEDTVRNIHAQGGLAVAAHPMLVMRYIDPDMLTADGVGADVLMNIQFDAIEIVNGSPIMKDENARARLLNRTVLFRAETGGSDAHIADAIGKAYTLFPGKKESDLRRAIQRKTSEAVSSKYRIRELLRYVRFYAKAKLREMGKRIFGRGRRERREGSGTSKSVRRGAR